jgi:hypothetical protein
MATHPIADKEVEVPEWEHTGAATDNGTATRGPTLRQKFDSAMPPHKKYLGMRRKVFLLVLLAAVLALLALIIGLAVGLSQKSKYESRDPHTANLLTIASANRRICLYLRIPRLSLATSRTIRQDSALAV